MPRNPLEAVHKRLGAFLVERGGTPVAARYGDVRAEHAATRNAVGVFDLCSAGKIAVRGEERVRFLQGLLAEDVSQLSPERGFYSLLLAREGRIAGEMRVVATPDAVLLFTPSLARAKVRGILERHVAATRASVVDETAVHALVSVQGRRAADTLAAVLGSPPPALADHATALVETPTSGPVLLIGAPRAGERGFDLLLPPELVPPLFEALVLAARALGGGAAGLESLDSLRVESGLPAYGADMDETTLPTEVGAPPRGISTTKGCFLGREVWSATQARGNPDRRIAGLLFEGSCAPVRGDRLLKNGVGVGAVTSGAMSPMLDRPVALAMLSFSASQRGTRLATIDGENVVVVDTPFWQAPPAVS